MASAVMMPSVPKEDRDKADSNSTAYEPGAAIASTAAHRIEHDWAISGAAVNNDATEKSLLSAANSDNVSTALTANKGTEHDVSAITNSVKDKAKNKDDKTNTKCPFFDKLPREIRDEIYALAYITSKEVVTVRKMDEWAAIERSRREDAYQIRNSGWGPRHTNPWPTEVPLSPYPFPTMMASKQFFSEATQIWLSNKTVRFDSPDHLLETMRACPGLEAKVAKLRVDSLGEGGQFNLLNFDGMDNLRSLEVSISEDLFVTMNDCKISCLHEYTWIEMFKVISWGCKGVPYLRSFSCLKLVPGESTLVETDIEKRIWERNVTYLEEYLRETLMERQLEGEMAEVVGVPGQCMSDVGATWSRLSVHSNDAWGALAASSKDGGKWEHPWATDSDQKSLRSLEPEETPGFQIPESETWGLRAASKGAVSQKTAAWDAASLSREMVSSVPQWVKSAVAVVVMFVALQTISLVATLARAHQMGITLAIISIVSVMANILTISWLAWSG